MSGRPEVGEQDVKWVAFVDGGDRRPAVGEGGDGEAADLKETAERVPLGAIVNDEQVHGSLRCILGEGVVIGLGHSETFRRSFSPLNSVAARPSTRSPKAAPRLA